MKIIHNVKEMQSEVEALRLGGKKIAVVPTMGALHQGHISLVKIAKSVSDITILTIFVNPLQFGPNEDFERYPRQFDQDAELAKSYGVDIIFNPGQEELYPDNYYSYVCVNQLTEHFEGSIRPDHFKGVTTVVSKLFNITKPHYAIFGEKDAQQLAILRKMTRDLNFDIDILAGPIIREPDGLAMSSRNVYLSEAARIEATRMFKTIQQMRSKLSEGMRDTEALLKLATKNIKKAPLAEIDYLQLVEADTFKSCTGELSEGKAYIFILAVKFGSTRLLDNFHFTI